MRFIFLLSWLTVGLNLLVLAQSKTFTPKIIVYPDEKLGPVKPIHGVNCGPIDRNYLFDFSDYFKEASIPSVRLHDAPLKILDVVDLHCLFPDPSADPEDPNNYDFTLTDDYLKTVKATGAEIYFRLGESIEHQPTKKYVRPELWDPSQLAKVCVNIVRHYNDGWNNGFYWGIKYWEFWNEPDLDKRTWTGTPDEFFIYYKAVANALKNYNGLLKVGGASFAGAHVIFDTNNPYHSFFQKCAQQKVPLDFVSWHIYPSSWKAVANSAEKVRYALDTMGFSKTESHLTEWTYLAQDKKGRNVFNTRKNKQWEAFGKIRDFQLGASRTPFIFGLLSMFQDLPIDKAHHYTGDTAPEWGAFDFNGLPNNVYVALNTFSQFTKGENQRVLSEVSFEKINVLACKDGEQLNIGIANLDDAVTKINLKIETLGRKNLKVVKISQYESDWKDIIFSQEDFSEDLVVPIAGPGLTLVTLIDE
ncbi:hypothetical protein KZP23_12910 [Echinicola marina]|uniref:GH39 family glycosyl hydrolase n=1 Tax=Echinicola marina TaxID=2859768 RepID=UPI001CF626E0|nr:hypothetical protein [Echinicola marina]UCS91649.1 hypothetical protein KZP23_12910 [Echinicola marina]